MHDRIDDALLPAIRRAGPRPWVAVAAALVLGAAGGEAAAQEPVYDPALYEGLHYREIGPAVGGRSTAFAGIPDRPFTFYMGTAGGGVWRTEDAGETWTPLTDGAFDVGTVGAIGVAPSDPNVIYVGTGETCIRGNVSVGRGMYRSKDGGDTWTRSGLEDVGQIGDVIVDPRDPERLWVAALGHPFGPNPERGVYRSSDGGESWEQVLFVSDSTGAVDLSMNPENPREIYAAMWRAERKPWTLVSGSRDSGLFKTTDGGDTWTEVGGGFPDGLVGKIGVSVSPADPSRVYALVEAEGDRGGLYRSDDRGRTWRQTNSDRKIRSRPFYYTHVHAHPTDENTVVVAAEDAWRSLDGGETFESFDTPHTDNHGIWYNPKHPEIVAVVNDGGMQISLNDTETWSSYINLPITEIYRVFVDDQFPYRVYGPVQDFSTLTVPSWRATGHVDAYERRQFWYGVGGGESGDIQIDPRNPMITYAGSGGGTLDRVNRETGERRSIRVYPERQGGKANRDLRYRFQWNAPVRLSPHDPDVLYTTSQHVHRTTDQGQSWEVVSPDLTRGDERSETMGYAGGPITHDISGVEVYNTIFAFEPSPHDPQVLWAGSDDGLVHVTRDGGESWRDVTPPDLPAWSTVNVIEPSPHAPGRVFVTAYRYRMHDPRPYVFRTDDFGESWTRIADGTRGIPADHPVRVVREDPDRRDLLYAGTEYGIYVSFDGGERWQTLQIDLPVTPVMDLKVHRRDLVLATQGRGFWILDDVTPLHQIDGEVAASDVHLYRPRDAYRVDVRYSSAKGWPEPPPVGAIFNYYLAEDAGDDLALEVLDADGEVVRRFSSDSTSADHDPDLGSGAGGHRFEWAFREPGIEPTDDAFAWGGSGPKVVPGTYRARLTVGDRTRTQEFELRIDPRRDDLTVEHLREQHELARAVADTAQSLYDALRGLRSVREQARSIARAAQDGGHGAELVEAAEELGERLTSVEERLIQTRLEYRMDRLNFEPKLDAQYATLFSEIEGTDNRPTDASRERFRDLNREWSEARERLREVLEQDLAAFNRQLEEAGAGGVVLPETLAGSR